MMNSEDYKERFKEDYIRYKIWKLWFRSGTSVNDYMAVLEARATIENVDLDCY